MRIKLAGSKNCRLQPPQHFPKTDLACLTVARPSACNQYPGLLWVVPNLRRIGGTACCWLPGPEEVPLSPLPYCVTDELGYVPLNETSATIFFHLGSAR